MIKPQTLWLGTCATLLLGLMFVSPVKAQPVLVQASPASDSILNASPEFITLIFDRVLSTQGTSIVLRSDDQTFSFTDVVVIDSANRFQVSLKLPSLVDGVYQVHYTAKGIGSSTLAVGSYTFTVDPPDPELELVSPVNGEAFAHDQPIVLEMRTRSFEFGFFDNRIRIYVDNELHDEVQATSYQIDGLSPGVHEIRTVLAQLENTEFPETTNTIIVAVAQDDPETAGREQAAVAPPDPGLQMSLLETLGAMVLTTVLLGIGILLGRSSIR